MLTESGRTLLPYANRLKLLSDEASEVVANASGKHGGLLALGASQTIAYYILPKLVAGFTRENPRVNVTAKSGNTDEILQELVDHKIQLALIEGPAARKDLHVEPFMEDEVVLAVRAGHEWSDNSIPISVLQDAPLLMRENGSGGAKVYRERARSRWDQKKRVMGSANRLVSSADRVLFLPSRGIGKKMNLP